jgi:hypothetical protein
MAGTAATLPVGRAAPAGPTGPAGRGIRPCPEPVRRRLWMRVPGPARQENGGRETAVVFENVYAVRTRSPEGAAQARPDAHARHVLGQDPE